MMLIMDHNWWWYNHWWFCCQHNRDQFRFRDPSLLVFFGLFFFLFRLMLQSSTQPLLSMALSSFSGSILDMICRQTNIYPKIIPRRAKEKAKRTLRKESNVYKIIASSKILVSFPIIGERLCVCVCVCVCLFDVWVCVSYLIQL